MARRQAPIPDRIEAHEDMGTLVVSEPGAGIDFSLFSHTLPALTCPACLGRTMTAKPFRSKYAAGVSLRCGYCYTRSFLYSATSAVTIAAWQKLLDDPETGPYLRTLVLAKVEEIQREREQAS